MIGPDAIVSVVAYLCDDAGCVPEFVTTTVEMLRRQCAHYELILVDDHSTDATAVLVDALLQRHAGLRAIRLARRSGEEVAATAGLEAAVGDVVVFMRARLDPPAEIMALVQAASSNGGVVLGTAATRGRQGPVFRALRGLFYWAVKAMLRVHIPAHSTGFCCLSRAAVNTISRMRSKRRHLRLMACMSGYPIATHRYRPHPALDSWHSRTLGQAGRESLSLLVATSKTPLRLVSSMGILAGSLNLLYVLYVLAIYLFKKEVAPGWVTLSLQMAGMFFFVFLILVSLAEYVAQILEESQDNPLYHVESDQTSVVTAGTGSRNVLAEAAPQRGHGRTDEAA